MPTASIKKIIPCNKNDLVTMILDIEKYPEFVPWCLSGKIHRKEDKPDMIEMEADLTVGKKFLNQTYTSHVTYYKDNGKILVNNIGGPLKHLENKWQIREINNQSEVHFEIDFEIKNIVYNMIMQKSFDLGLKKIADAFEERAIKLYTKKWLQHYYLQFYLLLFGIILETLSIIIKLVIQMKIIKTIGYFHMIWKLFVYDFMIMILYHFIMLHDF